ncbi:MAG: hypothetical protein NZM35_01565 [Chitinophagales bacterium]|nr:hypothetical protein [Chitinophagales bacterium]MDW8418191.1 hypothetical protein [Chitinophagales bacterium]
MSQIKRYSEIRFKVGLDENNYPVDIKWSASDTEDQQLRDCKCIMLSMWDTLQKQTMRIDLWTNQLSTDEMHAHYFQSLLSMTEAYVRATGNPMVMEEMKNFVNTLARKTADWEDGQNLP